MRAKNLSYFIAFFLCLPLAIHGQEIQRLSKEAEAAFQAGQYSSASESYSALLKEDLNPQQRSLVYYNYGTSLLKLEKWVQARQVYKNIPIDEDTPPLIRLRLFSNTAVAYLQELIHRQDSLDETSEKFPQDIQSLLSLALEGLEAVELTLRAEQALATLEGRASQENPQQIQFTRKRIKREYARLYQRLKAYEILQLDWEQLSQRLLKSLQNDLSFLDTLGVSSQGQNYELKERAILQRDLEPFWDQGRVYLSKQEEKEHELLFLEAEKGFYSERDLLMEGQLWPARRALARSLLFLNTLKELSNEKDPILWILERRILLRERQRAAESVRPYFEALKAEELDYSLLLSRLLDQISFPEEENPDPIQVELARQLAKRLAQSVQDQASLETVHSEEAWRDLARYKQLIIPIADGLQMFRNFWDYTRQLSNWEMGDRTQALQMLREWEALEEKLELREQLVQEAEKIKTSQVLAELKNADGYQEQAIEGEEEALSAFWQASTRALYAWDLESLIESELTALIQAHHKTLRSDPLTPSKLRLLQDRGKELKLWIEQSQEKGVESSSYESLKKELDRAHRWASDSIFALRSEQGTLAKVFLAAARNDLMRVQRKWGQKPSTPKEVLETGVLEQGQTLDYNRSASTMRLNTELNQRWLDLLVEEQQLVLESVEDFPDSVLSAIQSQSGNSAGEQVDPSVIWQTDPWKEVMPLFEAGVLVAAEAKDELEKEQVDPSQAAQKKQQAIAYWKEALELLKSEEQQPNEGGGEQNSKQESSQDSSSNAENEQESSSEQPETGEGEEKETEQIQMQRSSASDILEELRMMVQEDQSEEKNPIPPKQGLRPW